LFEDWVGVPCGRVSLDSSDAAREGKRNVVARDIPSVKLEAPLNPEPVSDGDCAGEAEGGCDGDCPWWGEEKQID
jgi:hypothetical protein